MTDAQFNGSIAALRDKIDGIDDQLMALLNSRAALACEIGRLKTAIKDEAHSKREPSREGAIIARLEAANNGPFPRDAIAPIFNMVFAACLKLQDGQDKMCLTCDILEH